MTLSHDAGRVPESSAVVVCVRLLISLDPNPLSQRFPLNRLHAQATVASTWLSPGKMCLKSSRSWNPSCSRLLSWN